MRILIVLVIGATTAAAQTITATPEAALATAPLQITARGLQPGQVAIVRASTRDGKGTDWQSWAGFAADERGVIDVAKQAPQHGSYSGVDAMGLVWSMDVAGDDHGRVRFSLDRVTAFKVRFDLELAGKVVHSATVERQLVPSNVTRTDVRKDQLVGTLFVPKSQARSAIIVLGGAEGGIGDETFAGLLAAEGYVTLALAYFGVPPLRKDLSEIPIETFKNAMEYLKTQISPAARKVALLGTERGAEAALVTASLRSDVFAVIAFAPSSDVWPCNCAETRPSWTENGFPLKFVAPGHDPAYAPPSMFPIEPAVDYEYRLRTAKLDSEIRGEQISAAVLLIAGADDRVWPSAAMARNVAGLRRNDNIGDEMIVLPAAGHLINKFYFPAGSTRLDDGRLETGGTSAGNGRSTGIVWPALLKFLEKHSPLTPPVP